MILCPILSIPFANWAIYSARIEAQERNRLYPLEEGIQANERYIRATESNAEAHEASVCTTPEPASASPVEARAESSVIAMPPPARLAS
jgi:hypothetical protein